MLCKIPLGLKVIFPRKPLSACPNWRNFKDFVEHFFTKIPTSALYCRYVFFANTKPFRKRLLRHIKPPPDNCNVIADFVFFLHTTPKNSYKTTRKKLKLDSVPLVPCVIYSNTQRDTSQQFFTVQGG